MGLLPLDLTKKELCELLEITHSALSVTSDEELRKFLFRLRALVPCEYMVAGLGQTDSSHAFQGLIKVVNISYPPDWVTAYFEEGYERVDPILKAHFEKTTTQVWSGTFEKAKTRGEKEFIGSASGFGLSRGITLGLASHQERISSFFSFSGMAMEGHKRHQRILEYLLPHLHLALTQIVRSPSRDCLLSEREKEVLKWLTEGKTSWEVSQILLISERTVNFHVQNILEKLQASSRGHAIALALQQGLIGS